MKRLYLYWSGMVIVGALLAVLATTRYCRDVAAVSVDDSLSTPPTSQSVRVFGRVKGGSLKQDEAGIRFQLSGTSKTLSVQYLGEDTEAIRDLKGLAITGRWEGSIQTFIAQKIALLPHYEYVTAAYIIGLLPMLLFVFHMQRRVVLLYRDIKQERAYEPIPTMPKPNT